MPTDPKDTITPEAFSVAPELLGLALARPWRRLVAIALDFALVGVLAQAGLLVLSFAIALFLLSLALVRRWGAPRVGWRRVLLALAGLLFLFIAAVGLTLKYYGSEMVDYGAVLMESGQLGEEARPVGMAILGERQWREARAAPGPEEARPALRRYVALQRRLNEDAAVVRADLLEKAAASEAEKPWLAALLRAEAEALPALDTEAALAAATDTGAAGLDTTAAAQPAAVADTPAAADMLPERDATRRAIGPSIDSLTAEVQRLRAELAARPEVPERRGVVGFLRAVLDDLGIGLGWSGLYFTIFTVIMRGQTPGKRLLGIRVIRLDGRPIGWWASFERFGGYAAGLATGLLGFAQVWWDRNRRAIHDMISETVVVVERK